MNTAIADTTGTSHAPIITDIASPSFQSAPILPGAKVDFNLVFCLPEAAKPRDLVFTLRTINDKGSDVRVSLDPAMAETK